MRTTVFAVAAWAIGAFAAVAAEPITIGTVYPLSGSASFLGIPEQRALQMVVDDWNKAGGLDGHPVRIVSYDTEGNATKAAQEVRRLIESDHVDVVFGPSSSGECLAVIHIADELKTPEIAHGGTEQIVTPPLRDVFNSVPVDRVALTHVLTYLKKNDLRSIAMLSAADGYGQSGTRILKEIAGSFGITVVDTEEFNRQDPDMTAQVLRARQAGAQAFVIWSALPGPTVVVRNARAQGIDLPVIVGYGGASNDLVKDAGPALDGVLVSSFRLLVPQSLPDSDPAKPVATALYNEFKARYGTAPENFAQHSYDAALILQAAVGQIHGPITRDALRDAIEHTDVQGANGHFHFTPENHGGLDAESRALIMVRYQGGNWQTAE